METILEVHTRTTIDRIHEAIKEHGFLAQADFFAEEHINHGFAATREQTRAVLQDIVNTLPDATIEPILTMVQDEWAIGYYWFMGTHKGIAQHPYVHYGLLAGVPSTNKFMKVHHTHIFRIRDGQIIEHYGTRDDVAMVMQLGLELKIQQT